MQSDLNMPNISNILGQRLGNYRLTRLLGHGGFANVYLGEHVYLDTLAAIKVLQVQIGGGEREQFLKEARMIAHLIHPHIIRVLDFGIQGTTPFLVMDYAPNGTLRQRHPTGTRLPQATIVAYVRQVASALQYAHDHHFIHRDVKPGNLLIGPQDDILLSDFGTALIAQHTDSQSTQDTVGTIMYMAPEQIEGKPRPASDQYALGIVVYEWLSGQAPFRGSLTEIIAQHMGATPPPLHERFPDIPPDVEEAVRIALAKDPSQRFETIQAFARALEEGCQSRETVAFFNGAVPSSADQLNQNQPPLVLPAATSPRGIAPQRPRMASEQQHTQPAVQNERPAYGQQYQQQIAEMPGDKLSGSRRAVSRLSRQIIAMVIGAALYGSVYTFIVALFLQHKDVASDILYGLSVVIPLFFGVIFGPLAGLVTAIGGFLLGHAVSGAAPTWNNAVGLGLTGLLAGLAAFRTRRRSNKLAAFSTALACAVPAILLGEGFADCSSIYVQGISVTNATLNFLIFSLVELASGLVLLPVALAIYYGITRHKAHT